MDAALSVVVQNTALGRPCSQVHWTPTELELQQAYPCSCLASHVRCEAAWDIQAWCRGSGVTRAGISPVFGH